MPRPENPADPARSAPKEAGAAAVELLLRVESMAREALDLTELRQLIANETRKLNRARQVFVIEVTQRGGARLVGASGVANVDRNSALAGSIEALVAAIDREGGVSRILDFSLPAYCDPQSDLASAYPFREMMWLPLQERNGRAFGGLLMARESVWSKDDAAISRRLAATFAHAWRELATAHYFRPRIGARRRWALLSMLAVALLMVVPVPMTALAPVEIVARRPFIVAAPIDGVIDAIEVDPGATVTVGQPLARLSDTLLKSRVEVASREVALAEVRVKQATIMAFNDARGRHELGIAEADLELKKAEQFYASELLAKTVVRAERSGVAHYVDRKALEGRPVATGERIMEIAEPEDVEARLDLAVPDVVALSAESPVKLFLDVDPLAPWHGKVVRSDYRARPSDADVMSFRTFAQIEPGDRPPPRIGLRGTAQVVGRTTAFGVFLFRRPLTALRQWIGI
ncbi:MAG: HlyD family efflux transporter periplasmic adaptor subunit [Hyphomicrobiaceae bacterium]|nr:HlyD family efflux transporter periplasmic adaptor subunit [Hyphomicrobiaceae bacterium]